MEVILLKDVDHLGHEGDIVKVADGYARNYLFPKLLAEKSTPANQRALSQRRRAIERREAEKRSDAQALVEGLAAAGIVIQAAVGEGGRLHGQVTSQQISEAIQQQTGIQVNRRNIEISTPIRELGDFTVNARLYKEVRCEVTLHVVPVPGEETPLGDISVPAPAEEPPAQAEAEAVAPTETISEDTGDEDAIAEASTESTEN